MYDIYKTNTRNCKLEKVASFPVKDGHIAYNETRNIGKLHMTNTFLYKGNQLVFMWIY